jgi:hypothetical protein
MPYLSSGRLVHPTEEASTMALPGPALDEPSQRLIVNSGQRPFR